ncbi:nuclear transport factor 2 family protein [Flavobacterium sp. MMLR14_040]|uniref:nuclear transport factor 2 family protein n=1 Tax=Flavobacterium sp. MMLR14_040 TaxID=3093843 RepID=UPI0029907F49|nr:nuclear transport factor 2 family protein [Flavobacterium sp. MMLR14_040]MDW8850712.1 nuclear transport factor 2 family protein [Flavobacterium sp. MMLR14_040]
MKKTVFKPRMKSIKLIIAMLLIGFSAHAQVYTDEEIKTKETAEKFFGYIGAKDPEKIASMVSEKVDWYIFESKYMPWTGHRSKREEISVLFKTLFSYFVDGSEKLDAQSFLVRGNEVAVFGFVERTVKKNDKHFKMPLAIHITVENNLISKFSLYEETLIIEKVLK